jgi:hypothetical protein
MEEPRMKPLRIFNRTFWTAILPATPGLLSPDTMGLLLSGVALFVSWTVWIFVAFTLSETVCVECGGWMEWPHRCPACGSRRSVYKPERRVVRLLFGFPAAPARSWRSK